MIKDSVGNRLNEGHFVDVKLPGGITSLRGRIKSMNEGRITRIGGTRSDANGTIQPGLITIEILLPVEVDPRSNQAPAILRAWDPTGEDLKAAEAEKQLV
jgi:hypothetical protein